jgi:RNA polymerase-associated protein CTR9
MVEAIHQLANRSMEDALRSFEAVLKERPTNLIALLGKVCLLWSWLTLALTT